MHIIHSTQGVDWDAVVALFAAVGWAPRQPAEIRAAFEHSSHVVFLYQDGELAGFGRTVDDGQYYGMLVNVVPGKEGFYLKLGWERQAAAMIWPVSEEQRTLHVRCAEGRSSGAE